jgi:peptidoglycan/xylan/chitin deacetylase (PgdA/CDA1 family)
MYNLSKTNLPVNSLVITFDDGWRSNYKLLPIIRNYDHPVTIFLSTGFVGTNSIPGSRLHLDEIHRNQLEIVEAATSRKMLNHNEIIDMVESGVNFQSHGVNHRVSTTLQLDNFKFELDESKRFIENLTNQEVFAFCYPYNEAGINQARVVEGVGYQIARKGNRILNSVKSNKYLLNSIGISRNCTIKDLKKSLELAKMKTVKKWLIGHLH